MLGLCCFFCFQMTCCWTSLLRCCVMWQVVFFMCIIWTRVSSLPAIYFGSVLPHIISISGQMGHCETKMNSFDRKNWVKITSSECTMSERTYWAYKVFLLLFSSSILHCFIFIHTTPRTWQIDMADRWPFSACLIFQTHQGAFQYESSLHVNYRDVFLLDSNSPL